MLTVTVKKADVDKAARWLKSFPVYRGQNNHLVKLALKILEQAGYGSAPSTRKSGSAIEAWLRKP